MKKTICGVMLLIAAVAGLTGCKQKENNGSGNQPTAGELTLNKTEINIVPGESERLYATYSSGKGTFTWKSEDEGVATVGTNGVVTAIGHGTTNIVCTEAGGAKATCKVNVVTLAETFKSFPLAYIATTDRLKDSTIYDMFEVYVDDTIKTEELDTIITDTIMVRGYIAELNVRLFSEGALFADNDGQLTGPNRIAIISMPAYTYYIDHTTCPELLGDSDYVYNGVFTRTFETKTDNSAYSLVPTIVNEEAYMAHIRTAIDRINEGDKENYYKELGLASNEGFEGGMLCVYEYDADYGYQPVSWVPDALVTRARMQFYDTKDYKYMCYAVGAVEVQPVLGDYGTGVFINEDAFGKVSLLSDRLELGEKKIYDLFVPQAQSVPERGNKVDFIKEFTKLKQNPAGLQLGKKIR